MNVPNKLTVSRFILTIAFLAVFFSRIRYHETISLALFSIASLTDYFDGKIARRDNLITNFGILMDPLADKILICSAFIAFVDRAPNRHELEWMPAWMAVVIVARELAITGLRLLAASKNVVLAAERYGKHKTISQIVCIISVLVLASHVDWGWLGNLFSYELFGFGPWVVWFTEASKWIAVTLTGYSGVMYLWRNRALYLDDL
ncbi:MAG: CDP-diacylglycerol--glycerol-3-phosphate 3-phosphatidyltransferase [Verrucomicrobiota bacterium]